MKNSSKLTSLMLVQQLEPEFWPYFDSDLILNTQNNLNIEPLMKEIVERIESSGIEINEAHGIIHDKDVQINWDDDEEKTFESTKPKHVHILLKFNKGATLNHIALTLGIEPQYLEKTKRGRYGYENVLAYLVHAKDESKFQYSPDEVITLRGEKYIDIYHQNIHSWHQGRASKKIKESNKSVDFIIDEILEGRLNKNMIMLSDELFKTYGLNQRKINDALMALGELRSYKTIGQLENNEFKKTILYIQAESGKGKTVLSKQLTNHFKNLGFENTQMLWEHCLTASTNAFDEYFGQEILILDDIRGYSLTVSDWLKLLDPHTISPISARYRNKMGSAKVIIITSTMTPKEFFDSAKGNNGEDLGQFIRRFDYLLKIEDSFKLSIPKPSNDPLDPSHIFENLGEYSKDDAIELIIDQFIINNNWQSE